MKNPGRFLHPYAMKLLTHWGQVTHICVGNLTIIDSDNGLVPIIWTNIGILFIGSLGTNLSEFLMKILTFWFKKMRLKVSSAKCLCLNVLITQNQYNHHKINQETNCLPNFTAIGKVQTRLLRLRDKQNLVQVSWDKLALKSEWYSRSINESYYPVWMISLSDLGLPKAQQNICTVDVSLKA